MYYSAGVGRHTERLADQNKKKKKKKGRETFFARDRFVSLCDPKLTSVYVDFVSHYGCLQTLQPFCT